MRDKDGGRRSAVAACPNQLRATLLDMSANELLKSLAGAGAKSASGKSGSVHPGRWRHCDAQSRLGNRSLAGRFLPIPGPPGTVIYSTALIAALLLSSAGCDVLQPGTTAGTSQPLRTDNRGAQALASPAKQSGTPSSPAQPVPQPAPGVSQPKPPPVVAAKGAEKLAAPNAPAPVSVSQRSPSPAAQPSKTPVTQNSGSVTGAPVAALFFKGPPPQVRPQWGGLKVLLWFGLGLVAAALAVVARLYFIRRAKPAELSVPDKEELKMPPELLMKEPVGLPEEVQTS